MPPYSVLISGLIIEFNRQNDFEYLYSHIDRMKYVTSKRDFILAYSTLMRFIVDGFPVLTEIPVSLNNIGALCERWEKEL